MWLAPNRLQIGDDTNAVIVDGLSPAHQRFIRALQAGIADNQVAAVARHTRLSAEDSTQLLARVAPHLLQNDRLESPKRPSTMQLLRDADPDFAELIAFALSTNRDGSAALAERANRVIHVERLDRTGVTLLRALASVGFAQFWTEDEGAVTDADVSSLGYDRSALGKPRFAAACQLAEGFRDRIAMLETANIRKRMFDRIDLALLVSGEASPPSHLRNLDNHGVPRIGIIFRSTGVLITPVVVPHKGLCVSCLEAVLLSDDPQRPVKIMQMQRSSTAYNDASSVLFAGAMAVASAAEFLDAQQGFEHSRFERTGWLFERASGKVMRVDWPEQASCGCFSGSHDIQSEERNRDGDAGRPNASSAA
ncbi:MAG: hypothetical protein RLZ88_568 [Actinomycetota bacterium]